MDSSESTHLSEIKILGKLCDHLSCAIRFDEDKVYDAFISRLDDNMIQVLVKYSTDFAEETIAHHKSLDMAKLAIDTLLKSGYPLEDMLEFACASKDINRVKYIVRKGNVCICSNEMTIAIDNSSIDIVVYLAKKGFVYDDIYGISIYCNRLCADSCLAEYLYNKGVPIIPYDFKCAVTNTLQYIFKWLYSKSPDVCDPETKAKAIELGWIAHSYDI
jgi:hypothetical protein